MIREIKRFIIENIKFVFSLIIVSILIFLMMGPHVESDNQKENEYIIKLKDNIKLLKEDIPKTEDDLRLKKIKLKCYETQDDRIKNNQKYDFDYCDKIENYETGEVSFFIEKVSAKGIGDSSPLSPTEIENKVRHKYWNSGDERQKWIKYLYEKSGYDKDILYTFLGENGTFGLLRKSLKKGDNGYYDFGICQLNYKRHHEFIDSEDFKDPYKQLDYCISVWKEAKEKNKLKTTFYAYNSRDIQKVNFEFYY